jgi:hypothetical protein
MPVAAPGKSKRWLPWALGGLAFLVGLGIGGAGSSTSAKTTTSVEPAVAATVTATLRVPVPGPTKTLTHQILVTVTPGAGSSFGDGTYVVGTDIKPGIYKTSGGGDGACGWTRLSNLSGGFEAIIANGIASGPTTVEVLSGDKAFQLEGGCSWSKIG